MNYTPNQFGKVAVLMGGPSSEREVSLMTGKAVLEALQNQKIDAHGIDVDKNIGTLLMNDKFDRVFIALHGEIGEDGVIQGALDILGIPYTGSGVGASALAMDKIRSKWIWNALNLPSLPFNIINPKTNAPEVIEDLGLPLAVKPVGRGSSLGVTRVNTEAEFENAKATAMVYDDQVMAEPWVEGRELTVGILADEALPVIHIESPQGFYDYEAKYFSEATLYHCPSGLDSKTEAEVQKLALKAYRALGCRHWGRVDLIQDKSGKNWLLEVNTIPGLTSHSLVPKAARVKGIDFNELVIRILAQTLKN